MAVDPKNNDILKFTVFLESGAIWSGLPLEALWCEKYNDINISQKKSNEILQPYTCLDGPAHLVQYDLLKNADLETKIGKAHYLFTINYTGNGLADDPEQYKTHNIIVLESGQLAALPNNYITVKNNWFSTGKTASSYKRNSEHYFAGG